MYALKVFSDVSELETKTILQVFETVGVAAFLQTHPFQSLNLRQALTFQNQTVLGLYSYQTGETEICVSRATTEYGVTYQHQRFWSISSLANTPLQAVQITCLHETGHHIHAHLREVDLQQFGQTMLVPRSNALSHYGMSRNLEYFAECFAAFVFKRTELFTDDSLGYAMIERALTRLGIVVHEVN
jgi:hypothetical protein